MTNLNPDIYTLALIQARLSNVEKEQMVNALGWLWYDARQNLTQPKEGQKDLSYLDASRGGALVKPAEWPKKKKPKLFGQKNVGVEAHHPVPAQPKQARTPKPPKVKPSPFKKPTTRVSDVELGELAPHAPAADEPEKVREPTTRKPTTAQPGNTSEVEVGELSPKPVKPHSQWEPENPSEVEVGDLEEPANYSEEYEAGIGQEPAESRQNPPQTEIRETIPEKREPQANEPGEEYTHRNKPTVKGTLWNIYRMMQPGTLQTPEGVMDLEDRRLLAIDIADHSIEELQEIAARLRADLSQEEQNYAKEIAHFVWEQAQPGVFLNEQGEEEPIPPPEIPEEFQGPFNPEEHIQQEAENEPTGQPEPTQFHPGPDQRGRGAANTPGPRTTSPDVAQEAGEPGNPELNQGEEDFGELLGFEASGRLPPDLKNTQRRLKHYQDFFQRKNIPQAAGWFEEAQRTLGKLGDFGDLPTLSEEKGEQEPVYYRTPPEKVKAFAEALLNMAGISILPLQAPTPEEGRVISPLPPAEEIEVRPQDFYPTLPTFKDKLEEARQLPGLQTTKGLGELAGKTEGGKVHQLSNTVMARLNETYGDGQWVVKPYSDEGRAGYGILFPQFIQRSVQDARSVIQTNEEKLAKWGFHYLRESPTGDFGNAVKKAGDLRLPTNEEKEINQQVLSWAEKNQFLFPEDRLAPLLQLPKEQVGGLEVYNDAANSRFYRILKAGSFGDSRKIYEFLKAHALANNLWPGLACQFLGVTKDQNGEAVLVTATNHIDGKVPDEFDLEEWFEREGWQGIGDGAYIKKWFHPKSRSYIRNAEPKNFRIMRDGSISAIDIDSLGITPGKKMGDLLHEKPARVVGLKDRVGNSYRFGDVQWETRETEDSLHKVIADMVVSGTPNYQNLPEEVKGLAHEVASASPFEHGYYMKPGLFLAQPAFAAVGVTNEDRAKGFTYQTGTEGRVHIATMNGKAEIIPYASIMKLEQLPIIIHNDDTRAMEKAALDAANFLEPKAREGQLYGFDVIKTKDGWRVNETNPSDETGASGWLQDKWYIMDAFVSWVMKRDPLILEFFDKITHREKLRGKKRREEKHLKIKSLRAKYKRLKT